MALQYIDRGDYNVVVVGAASGIGLQAARFLAGQGVRIAALDRNKDGAEAAARQLGGKATARAVDVTDWNAVQSAIDGIAGEFGRIDALVNCAGITGKTNVPTHEVDIDDFDAVYRINLKGALLLTKAVLPHMLAKKYGRILHVASIAGKEGNAGMAAYSATKAGLIGLVKTVGKDYAETGITVNALAPAVIRTPMVDALPQATVDYMTAKIPMRRCGELQEAAELIGWIVSPACSFTTGFTFDLTGGRAVY
ncbi:MAG TPA: SDR family NAD(P)-dependent oxidoreductase [Dongiaceae bacterium]|nr:SDR family NAD(P)-dependent oxidoreductase [Dongiaceae bacterium]